MLKREDDCTSRNIMFRYLYCTQKIGKSKRPGAQKPSHLRRRKERERKTVPGHK